MADFTVLHNYNDGSGSPTVIYIGSDKAAAFDALWNWLKNDTPGGSLSGELHKFTAPTPFMEQITGGNHGRP